MRRQDRLVPLVNPVADGLADEMIRDGIDREIVPLELIPLGRTVAALLKGSVDLEVISPAGEFKALVAKLTGLTGKVIEWQVGPLACK